VRQSECIVWISDQGAQCSAILPVSCHHGLPVTRRGVAGGIHYQRMPRISIIGAARLRRQPLQIAIVLPAVVVVPILFPAVRLAANGCKTYLNLNLAIRHTLCHCSVLFCNFYIR
jgi:hypothetical protein